MKLKLIFKGGSGSGNWGHYGREGIVGGSAKGGGLARIGAGKDFDVQKRQEQAVRFRALRQMTQGQINDWSNKLQFDKRKVKFGGNGYKFDVGDGIKRTAAGSYNPKTGEIMLYEGSFAGGFMTILPDVFAHEVMHDKVKRFEDKVAELDGEVGKRLQEEANQGIYYQDSFMRPDGSFRSTKDQKHYKALEIRDRMLSNYQEFYQEGFQDANISDYAKAYWDTWFRSPRKDTERLYNAFNETLAEIAAKNIRAPGAYIPKNWKELYEDVLEVTNV